MLRRHRQTRTLIHQVLDACLFVVAFGLAYELRARLGAQYFGLAPVAPIRTFSIFYFLLFPTAPLILESQGFYDRPVICPRRSTIWPLLKGCLITTLGLTFAMYLFKLYPARFFPFLFGCTSFTLVYFKEELVRLVLLSRFAQAQYRRRFMLMGTTEERARIRRDLKESPEMGISIIAELDLHATPVEELVRLLHEHSINGVILSTKHTYFDQAEAVIRACELEGVETWLVADFFRTQTSRASFDDLYGHPVMVFRTTPEASWQSVFKQVMDLVGSLALLLVLALPLAVVALLIRLTSPGPVLFRQQRSGLNGAPFTIYKFRTMVTNAEQLKHELAAMNEMRGPVFKVSKDPRITPIGKWLRKYSIDEFPQLFNVLRGEMSLVGPRPLPVDEVKRFHDLAHRRRLSVKPGLTCLWQISGRNQIVEFKDWVRLDLEYIDNWSLWLDLKILLRTVPVVLLGTGAK